MEGKPRLSVLATKTENLEEFGGKELPRGRFNFERSQTDPGRFEEEYHLVSILRIFSLSQQAQKQGVVLEVATVSQDF